MKLDYSCDSGIVEPLGNVRMQTQTPAQGILSAIARFRQLTFIRCYIRRNEDPHVWGSILAARILMVLSASIVFTLGVVHLVYTFSGPMLTPRDPTLQISMSQISPVITKETTMWRCWVGFNASHSMGLILFGLIFGFLALAHGQLLFRSPFLLVVGLVVLGGFVVLSKVYWFSAPFTGTSISLACYVASIALSRA